MLVTNRNPLRPFRSGNRHEGHIFLFCRYMPSGCTETRPYGILKHIHIRTHSHTYTYIHIHIHTHTYAFTYVHIHIHTHTYTFTYIHIHKCDVDRPSNLRRVIFGPSQSPA